MSVNTISPSPSHESTSSEDISIILSEITNSPSLPPGSTSSDDILDFSIDTWSDTTLNTMSEDSEPDQDALMNDEAELDPLDRPRDLASPSPDDVIDNTAFTDLDGELLGERPGPPGTPSEGSSLPPPSISLRIFLISIQLSLEIPYQVGMNEDDFVWPVDINSLAPEEVRRGCPICLNGYDARTEATIALPGCGHVMGDNCTRRWMRVGGRDCPVCRVHLISCYHRDMSDSEAKVLKDFRAAARTYLESRDRNTSLQEFTDWAHNLDPTGTDEAAKRRRNTIVAVQSFDHLMESWD